MKHSFKFYSVALAAMMTIGSIAFVSCDKENDAVEPQNGQVTTKNTSEQRRIFPIDPQYFTDGSGMAWYLWGGFGHILEPGHVIELDIKFHHAFSSANQREREWHYIGTIKFDDEGNYRIYGATFRLTPELEQFLSDFARMLLRI